MNNFMNLKNSSIARLVALRYRRLVHALAHQLDVNVWVPGSEIRAGGRIQGDRCVGCGRFVARD